MADQKISQLTAATTPLAGTEVLPIVQGGATKQVSVSNLTAGRAVSANSYTASSTDTNYFAGYVGMGINPPTVPCHVVNATTPRMYLGSSSTKYSGLVYSAGATFGSVAIRGQGNDTGTVVHIDRENSQVRMDVGGNERFKLESNGNTTLTTGNLVIGTSGKGIDFSATAGTGTSELFSDYEEGTFSPVFADAISGGNLASTSNTYAQYTKVGNVVHCTISMLNINTTGLTAANAAYIQGLPFPTVSAGTNRFFPIYVRADSITSTVGIQGWILANAGTYIALENVTTSGRANLLVSAVSSGVGDLAVSFSYFTN